MGMGADRNVRDHGWMDLLPVQLRWGPRKPMLGGQPPPPLTGVSRCQKPNFSPSVSDVCHLASVLCFVVAGGSVCPTFHHESHLEAFVKKKKKPKILDPAESNSQGRLWLLRGNQSAVCVCVCVFHVGREVEGGPWRVFILSSCLLQGLPEGRGNALSEVGHIKVFCVG